MLISTSVFSLLTTKCKDIWLKKDIAWEMSLSLQRQAKVLDLNRNRMNKKTLAQRGETGQKHSLAMEALTTFYSNLWRNRYLRKQSAPLMTNSNSRKSLLWLFYSELSWVLLLLQMWQRILAKRLHLWGNRAAAQTKKLMILYKSQRLRKNSLQELISLWISF